MFVGKREIQFIIKLPVFKEKKCSYLYNNFASLEMKEKIANWGYVAS